MFGAFKLKQYIPAMSIVLALAVLAILWRVFNPPKARVVSVLPAPNAEDVELDISGRVVFDREIGEDWAEITVSPEVPVLARLPLEKRSLVFTFQKELEPETVYTVSIAGRRVVPFSWRFRTRKKASEVRVPGDDFPVVPPEEVAEAQEEYARENPLLQYTPYLTEDFKITRIARRRAKVDLYAEDKEAVRQEVLDWFRKRNIDPETLDIQWVE